MNRRHSEQGQALILIVFAAVGLFAFTALAIDGSRVFSDRRHAQNAADTAVLAASLAKVRGNDFSLAALDRARSNGFDNGVNSTVEVHQCSEPELSPPCEGLPFGADATQYLQVVIRSNTPTTFARILGWQQVPNVASAIARAVTGVPGASFQSPAVSALSLHDPAAVEGNGHFNLDIINSGIFSNSDSTGGCPSQPQTNSLWFHGSGTYKADAGFQVVGTHCAHTVNPIGDFQSAPQIPYPPAIDIPAPSITCSGDTIPLGGGAGTIIVPPGNHPNFNIPGGMVTFAPGNHCFPDGFRISGPSHVTISDANFLISGGVFDMSANGSLTCNNLLVHINGGTGMHFNGNAVNNCMGVTIYASTGNVRWNGTVQNVFSAPTSGTYKGLLLYLPYGNSNKIEVSGNASSEFTGSIIAVSSQIELQGNNATLALSTKIMGHTVKFSGVGNFVIDYDPSQQYAQGEPTMIQVIK